MLFDADNAGRRRQADTYAKVGAVYVNATVQLSGTNDNHGSSAHWPHLAETVRARAGGGAGYPVKPKARMMVVNALSELDAPGNCLSSGQPFPV